MRLIRFLIFSIALLIIIVLSIVFLIAIIPPILLLAFCSLIKVKKVYGTYGRGPG